MTQARTRSAFKIEKLPLKPICSPEEAREKFQNCYLDKSHVTLRLNESTHIVTPQGKTKILFLKNVLPTKVVTMSWETLQKFRFKPAKNSRRSALQGSTGGELLLGWLDMARRSMGTFPGLTTETRTQWATFRELWPLLWMIQYLYNKFLPEYSAKQQQKAGSARETLADYLLRTAGIEVMGSSDGRKLISKDDIAEELRRWEKKLPDAFAQFFCIQLAQSNPEYLSKLIQQVDDIDQGLKLKYYIPLGLKDGNVMTGYTVPGTMFSTITVNQTALFRAHEDGNNLAGSLSCLAAFGNFSGAELCFPRFGVSCPMEPGDLLIGDTNRELHGNLGPLTGSRISVVAYMRDALARRENDVSPIC
jgi:hypothetical protein